MSWLSISLLALQGTLFPVWILLAFRWLFALHADAVRQSGTSMPGSGWAIRAFCNGLTERRYAKERRWLGLLTLTLLGLSSLQAMQ